MIKKISNKIFLKKSIEETNTNDAFCLDSIKFPPKLRILTTLQDKERYTSKFETH